VVARAHERLYDLVVTVDSDPSFEYRSAGHLENGNPASATQAWAACPDQPTGLPPSTDHTSQINRPQTATDHSPGAIPTMARALGLQNWNPALQVRSGDPSGAADGRVLSDCDAWTWRPLGDL